ncbi:MAG: ribosomal RNA small subunit methyltransferase A [Sedimentisphaerales bacterium]|nr:ribosomal RNA small subunit methyltransferase A [Sedimentisphaerales bacterium]
MQTKKQIRQLLDSAYVRPNKKFGQHFLIDLNLMRLLVDSANINSDDIVLEVGCGTGSLTTELADKAGFVVAVELDRNLAGLAKSSLVNAANIELINTDILKNKHTLSPEVISTLESARKKYNGRLLLVANLPYNVASPVMMNLVTGPVVADAMYVTVQKEVADRMTALPGSDDYGILSILLNAVGDVRIIRVLRPGVFWPRPQVDSAMVEFVLNPEKFERIKNMDLFVETVNLFMGHRRKTLTACSRLASAKLTEQGINWSQIFGRCGITPTNRPDKLTSEDYIAVSNICFSVLAKI